MYSRLETLMPDPDDLTARARIRDAALAQFADVGFQKATIRSIAAEAGVSPGLLRHHFGSKEELRDAVDAHVLDQIREANAKVAEAAGQHTFSPAVSRESMQPFQRYFSRALLDGSPTIAALFDQVAKLTEAWIEESDKLRDDEPMIDVGTRAAAWTAMVFGVSLLQNHVGRLLGVDDIYADPEHRLELAMLDIYSHALITPELARQARESLDRKE
ncbi:TetR/AcrR family transcriptional regulator [Cryptosporangium phraense]|uniref:TetR/AcrR family transcriptional regulator n=1 Tax=Cryptosporangium phraense TaxID=2593070 RepID=A0A545AXC5_9ACTN|nr:TetR/AcrR family transcriptional regulator [Cryptosporangium phraense]TQS45958.1 TetR/AcrR family transcriptional regulator [Cryptosporangium phraense]